MDDPMNRSPTNTSWNSVFFFFLPDIAFSQYSFKVSPTVSIGIQQTLDDLSKTFHGRGRSRKLEFLIFFSPFHNTKELPLFAEWGLGEEVLTHK